MKLGDTEYKLSNPGTRKDEIIEELKKVEDNDLEDMVFRMESTYSEIEKTLDMKHIDTSTIGHSLPPGINEISDNNLMLKFLLPDEVKVNISNDDIRLKSNLITNKTICFTRKTFFYMLLGFTIGPLGDTGGYGQLIPGTYKIDKPNNITGIDKVRLKCDCINGSIVNSIREPF